MRTVLDGLGLLLAVGLAGVLNAADETAPSDNAAAGGKPYVLGTQNLPIPKLPIPERGKPFEDPTFGTRITRITDPADGWGKTYRRHSYSCYSPLNADGTLTTCQENQWHLYDVRACKHLKKLEGPKGDAGAPRWDFREPNVFYFCQGTALKKFDLKIDAVTVVHDFQKDFPDMKWLCMKAYAEPSADSRYWPLHIMLDPNDEDGRTIALAVYDKQEDRIVGKMPRDNNKKKTTIRVTPSGQRVIVGIGTVAERPATSVTSYKPDFTGPVELCGVMGHSDLALDTEGREVVVYPNDKTDYICMQDVLTGKETPLLSAIHDSSWEERKACGVDSIHISGNCYATPGWVAVPIEGFKKDKDCWNSRVIYLLKLEAKADPKKPVIWRVAHTHCVKIEGPGAYWVTNHATIDRYGRTLIFASNWDDPKAPIEDYRCDLPEGWYEKLMGAEKATEVRAKAARTLGISVEELVGK